MSEDEKKRDRALQRRVRARLAKTGESYQAAWRQLTRNDVPAEYEDVRGIPYGGFMDETSTEQTKESKKVKKAVKDEFFSKPNATLEDAKRWLRERFGKGATCPCCNQFVKLYKRPFNYSMAVVLLLMERYYRRVGVSAEEWLHVPTYITEAISYHSRGAVAIRGGDWAKMKYWGLIEEKPETRDDGSPRAGFWRMTALGRQFATRAAKVPSHVYVYNGEPMQKTSEELITIDDALGTKFNYAELMADA